MISSDVSNTETLRNVYIIDDKGIVRAILVYPINIGRCIPEIIRLLQALQIADYNNAQIPANWNSCEPIITPMPQTYAELEERINSSKNGNNGFSWYLQFKQPQNCSKMNLNEENLKQIE
jgi:peroxiredoxin (alkyl hydroperoxide reductase subunit C)